MKYVLDTNIVTRLLSGDERVLAHLVDLDPSDVGIPLLVLASRFSRSAKPDRMTGMGDRMSGNADRMLRNPDRILSER
ncbi:MAG: hypothetical protein EOO73_09975 [Myxococcales bacterium]|nr:MAG: hypothetical protein EOO73_09975 [Myxococcales bacterium]